VRYQWKKTWGRSKQAVIVNRGIMNSPSSHTGLFPNFGLGFYVFPTARHRASPLPILNCGMACSSYGEVVLSMSWPYVQDALDLIEFANGM